MSTYGVDFTLKDGDIVVTPGGDIQDTQHFEDQNSATNKFPGYYSMLFSIMDRISTIKGDNIWHPEYGSNVFNILGTPNSNKMRQALKLEIEKTLLEDPRVKEVKLVDIEQVGRTVSCKAL